MIVNSSMDFDLGLVNDIRVNRSAVEARAQTLGTRRTFKVESQVAAYLRAVQCIDLTTLSGDDTSGRVGRLCAKALNPVSREILEKLGLSDFNLIVGAVCVYPVMVKAAVSVLGEKIPVASVATGFPTGQLPAFLKVKEIEYAIECGAKEIDIVISRRLVLEGKWKQLYEEIKLFRAVCGEKAKMKTILGVGDLKTLENIAKAAAIAIMAGSDFIKTSTGLEPINATLETGLVMIRQIRRFSQLKGALKTIVGFKAAGGIKTAKDAMLWLTLILEELDEDWAKPDFFRIGASSLLNDLERQLYHLATGRYSAEHHHPMG